MTTGPLPLPCTLFLIHHSQSFKTIQAVLLTQSLNKLQMAEQINYINKSINKYTNKQHSTPNNS
jgi:hypothetical protein